MEGIFVVSGPEEEELLGETPAGLAVEGALDRSTVDLDGVQAMVGLDGAEEIYG